MITEVTLPATVTTIEYAAFSGCSGLTAVTLTAPSGVQTIGTSAFSGCSALVSMAIPDPVTTIGVGAFNGCAKLATVTISTNSGLESIGGNAFLDCRALTGITIPESVTSIGYAAFSYCEKLTTMTIPKKVTALGEYAFDNCTDLSTITFRGPTPTLGTNAIAAGTTIRHYGNYSGYDGWAGMDLVHILAEPVISTFLLSNKGTPAVDLIDWGDSSPGATSYQVYVSENSDLSGAISIAVSDTQATIKTGLEAGKWYYFAVKALDAEGESRLSQVIFGRCHISIRLRY